MTWNRFDMTGLRIAPKGMRAAFTLLVAAHASKLFKK
jgi:hypothetical protein